MQLQPEAVLHLLARDRISESVFKFSFDHSVQERRQTFDEVIYDRRFQFVSLFKSKMRTELKRIVEGLRCRKPNLVVEKNLFLTIKIGPSGSIGVE